MAAVGASAGGVEALDNVLAKLAQREFEDLKMERDVKLELKNRIAMGRRLSTRFDTEALGLPSDYVWPDCHGSLQEVSESNYRFRVGHAWTADSLLRARDEEFENAFRVALRSLQEKSKPARWIADNAGLGQLYDKYNTLADEAEQAMSLVGERSLRLMVSGSLRLMVSGSLRPMRTRVSVAPADDARSLTVSVREMAGTAVLCVHGFLDGTTYLSLRDAVIKAALDEPRAVIIDVTALVVPAPSAWVVFTSARWHISHWPDVPMALVCAHHEGREAIHRNGVTRYLSVYPSLRAAVDALSQRSAQPARQRRKVALPATLASVAASRDLVTEWLTDWERPELISVAKLVVTVFVENVLQHTKSAPLVRLESAGDAITVAVEDDSPVPAARLERSKRGGDEVSGLAIVAALCRTWGTAPTPAGKTVWAVIGPENRL